MNVHDLTRLITQIVQQELMRFRLGSSAGPNISLPSALPPNGTAGGDLSGSFPDPAVAKIRTVLVSAAASTPADSDILVYSQASGYWRPEPLVTIDATEPTPFAQMIWVDPGTGAMKVRDLANSAWITISGGGGETTVNTHATLWHDEDTVLTGNPLTWYPEPATGYNRLAYQDTPADGDSFSQDFVLAAGTYNLFILGEQKSDCGKIDWAVDGVNIATGQDWYSSMGVIDDVSKTVSGVVIATSGLHTLKGTINGKHGGGGDYFMRLTKMWFSV